MQQTLLIVCATVLSLCFSCRKESDREFAERLAQESTCYIQKGRLDSALLVNLRILEGIDTLQAENADITAATYNNLGDIFYKATIFDKALHMYERSLAYASRLSDKTEESHARRGLWRCSWPRRLSVMSCCQYIIFYKELEEVIAALRAAGELEGVIRSRGSYEELSRCCAPLGS